MILNVGGIGVGGRTRGNVCYFEDVIKDQSKATRRLLLHAWWLLGSTCATTYVADCFLLYYAYDGFTILQREAFHAK